MGIKSLFPFLSDSAPLAIKETKVEAMTGREIAIDASMCLYQFLVAVRQGEAQANLSNAAGDVTSHIQGFLARTVRLLELGLNGLELLHRAHRYLLGIHAAEVLDALGRVFHVTKDELADGKLALVLTSHLHHRGQVTNRLPRASQDGSGVLFG